MNSVQRIASLSLILLLALDGVAQKPTAQSPTANGSVTVIGYLRDTECLLKNQQAGEANTPVTQQCMRACFRGGSPLGILTRSRELYTILGEDTPDTKLRTRVAPYLGKYVRVTGIPLERGGTRAIEIKTIALDKH